MKTHNKMALFFFAENAIYLIIGFYYFWKENYKMIEVSAICDGGVFYNMSLILKEIYKCVGGIFQNRDK